MVLFNPKPVILVSISVIVSLPSPAYMPEVVDSNQQHAGHGQKTCGITSPVTFHVSGTITGVLSQRRLARTGPLYRIGL